MNQGEAMTRQRKLIADIIMNSMGHMTAEEIFLKAKEEMPTIAIGTVYRNLGLMVNDGDIVQIKMAQGPDKYDKNVHCHDHAICKNCCKVIDICHLKDILSKATNLNITEYDCNIYYLCDTCKKES